MNEKIVPFKDFFEDKHLVIITDRLAQRYGMTPYEILTTMSVTEFSFNVSVLMVVLAEEQKEREQPNAIPSKDVPKGGWGKKGFHRTVVKKEDKK